MSPCPIRGISLLVLSFASTCDQCLYRMPYLTTLTHVSTSLAAVRRRLAASVELAAYRLIGWGWSPRTLSGELIFLGRTLTDISGPRCTLATESKTSKNR